MRSWVLPQPALPGSARVSLLSRTIDAPFAMILLALLLSRARPTAVRVPVFSRSAAPGDVQQVAEEAGFISEKLATRGRIHAELAHEIGKPLGVLETLACKLRDGSIEPERQADALASMARLAGQLREIVRSVLEQEQESVASDPVQLADLIENARREVEDVHGSGRVLVHPLPRLRGLPINSQRLGRVLVNLLDNAIEAVGDARPVELRVFCTNHALFLEVRDEGTGISEQRLHRVTDPFVSFRKGGSGLGLWISRKIVEELGGSLEFESNLGRGTTARVQIPRANVEAAE